MGIPYTHSGVVASSVAMNKVMSRQLFRVGGIAVPTRLSLQEDNGVLIHKIMKALMLLNHK